MPDLTKEHVLLTMTDRAGVWVRVHAFLLLALRKVGNRGVTRPIVEAFMDELGRKLVEVGLFSQKELATIKDLEARTGGWGSSNRPNHEAGKEGAE